MGIIGNHKDEREQLLAIVKEVDPFRTPGDKAFASIFRNGHLEYWPVASNDFRLWLESEYFQRYGDVVSGPTMKRVVSLIEARARYEGRQAPVFTRVARQQNALYLDLCDEHWHAIEITRFRWDVIDPAPVNFRRSEGMLHLPMPERGGDISELRKFVNLRNPDDWVLYVSWLIACFRPRGPYPILALHGEQGTAKSTAGRVARELVDPYRAALRMPPSSERDLMIAASRSHVFALDNLSCIPVWLSDALCSLATGGGLGTRKLYSDEGEILFDVQRPVVLNGIEDLASRGDLLDRMIVLYLPQIPENRRQSEEKFWADFQEAAPRILGALLDAVSAALRRIETLNASSLPRMADFAVWAMAAEEALGLKVGDFMRAYQRNRAEANRLALESSPVGSHVRDFMIAKHEWTGTSKELLGELNNQVDNDTRRQRLWPATPKALSNALSRCAPNLRAVGIKLIRLQRKGGTGDRLFRLVKDGGARLTVTV